MSRIVAAIAIAMTLSATAVPAFAGDFATEFFAELQKNGG